MPTFFPISIPAFLLDFLVLVTPTTKGFAAFNIVYQFTVKYLHLGVGVGSTIYQILCVFLVGILMFPIFTYVLILRTPCTVYCRLYFRLIRCKNGANKFTSDVFSAVYSVTFFTQQCNKLTLVCTELSRPVICIERR